MIQVVHGIGECPADAPRLMRPKASIQLLGCDTEYLCEQLVSATVPHIHPDAWGECSNASDCTRQPFSEALFISLPLNLLGHEVARPRSAPSVRRLVDPGLHDTVWKVSHGERPTNLED